MAPKNTVKSTEIELNYDKIIEAFTITAQEVSIAELQERYRAAVMAVKEMVISDRNKRSIIENLYYAMRDEACASVSSPSLWDALYPDEVAKTANPEALDV